MDGALKLPSTYRYLNRADIILGVLGLIVALAMFSKALDGIVQWNVLAIAIGLVALAFFALVVNYIVTGLRARRKEDAYTQLCKAIPGFAEAMAGLNPAYAEKTDYLVVHIYATNHHHRVDWTIRRRQNAKLLAEMEKHLQETAELMLAKADRQTVIAPAQSKLEKDLATAKTAAERLQTLDSEIFTELKAAVAGT